MYYMNSYQNIKTIFIRPIFSFMDMNMKSISVSFLLSFLLFSPIMSSYDIYAQSQPGMEVQLYVDSDKTSYQRGEIVNIRAVIPGFSGINVQITIIADNEIQIFSGDLSTDHMGLGATQFLIPDCISARSLDITAKASVNNQDFSDTGHIIVEGLPPSDCEIIDEKPPSDVSAGEEPPADVSAGEEPPADGGGCLIATAAFNSELSPTVQKLREIRDKTLLQTSSGIVFMKGFNQFYYSFSPTIADWERQSPIFKEVVKTAITPLLASLSILNYADIDSEEKMLAYGISVILLNVGMYFVLPVIVVSSFMTKIKHRK